MIIVLMDGCGAKRGNLDDFRTEAHVREAKSPADQPAVAKQRLDLLRRRVGRNIEVLGVQFEHGVAHAAAHEEGLVARLVQSVQNLECAVGKLSPRDVVIRPRDYSWFFGPVLRVLGQYRSV